MEMFEYNHFCHCHAPNSKGENEKVRRTPRPSITKLSMPVIYELS
jgi:hypothetical protein